MLTDFHNFGFNHAYLMDTNGHLRKILDMFVDSSRTLMDFYEQLLFYNGYLTNTYGLSRMILDFFTDA